MVRMRCVFFGSADFAVPTLRGLHHAFSVAAVFTQPDKMIRRGGSFTPVKECALTLNIPVEQPNELNDETLSLLAKYHPEIIIVVAYGKLIPAPWLALPKLGWFNLHPSLLPLYRGAAPVPHCILNGDAETGVTIFKLNERFDCGEILAVEKITLTPNDTSVELLAKLSELGANLLIEKLKNPTAWKLTPQVNTVSSYARKFTKLDGKINWDLPAEIIHRQIRALQPWPLSYTFFGDEQRQLTILEAEILPAPNNNAENNNAGKIIIDHQKLLITCGDQKLLQILTVIPEGRKLMSVADFLRGVRK